MWLAARWRRALGARAAIDRRHRRSWLAAGGRARGARRQASGAQRSICRIARCAGPAPSRRPDCRPRRATARYRLLAQAARASGATHILTAHTRDDQAETLLMRMLRGSGIAGLAAMARETERDGVLLARPLLDVPKSQLVATLSKAKIGFADDPTNRDTELHAAAAARADAGAGRRGRRQPEPGAAGVAAGAGQCRGRGAGRRRRALSRAEGSRRCRRASDSTPRPLPVCPRKSGCGCCMRAIDRVGHEGPAELGKVEALLAALDRAIARWREAGKAETDPRRGGDQPDRRPNSRRTGTAAPRQASVSGVRYRDIRAYTGSGEP